MIQQFIELGQGYGDVYELIELIETNKHRFHQAFIFTATTEQDVAVASLAVAFKPTGDSKFMPIYLCREGIPYNEDKLAQRITLFTEAVNVLERKPVTIELKHSSAFKELALYYQHITGILRMNNYLPQL